MAGVAVKGVVANPAGGGTEHGVSAHFIEFPLGADGSGGERATVSEDTGSSPTAATSDAIATKSAGTEESRTRGSGRKMTRLRSAAYSFANGVNRMHSRLRAATTGSVPATAGHQAAPASAELASPSLVLPPGASNTAIRSPSPGNTVSVHDLAEGSSFSQQSPPGVSHTAFAGAANQIAASPDHHLGILEEGEEAEVQQQQQQRQADNGRSCAFASGEGSTAADGEPGHEEHAAGDHASPATTATRASVMSTDLGGFYRKLLGEDWQEQLKELNPETNPLLAFEEGENLEADVAAAGGAVVGASIGGGGAAAAPGNELQLPDTYQGKTRQRIRRRDISDKPRDISDQVADDLHFGQDEEPLITPEDIAVIREEAWIPAGEGVPHLSEMTLGYHRAWDIGKKGCLAVKVDGLWDSAVKANKMRFFVMDGTDPESFLSFYSKSDLHAARGLQSERLGTLTAWDMRDGYWNYSKKKVFVKRSDVKKKKDCILEGFTAEFYDAMLLCIWEMCVQAATEQLKYQRRRERARRRQSLPLGLRATASGDRRRSPPPSGETRRVSAALLSYKNLPRGVGSVGVDGAKSEPTKAQEEKVAAQHREVVRQLIREGRALLARPITSRHARAAARRVNMRLPSRRRKEANEVKGGEQPQPKISDTPGIAAATGQKTSHESSGQEAPPRVAVILTQGQAIGVGGEVSTGRKSTAAEAGIGGFGRDEKGHRGAVRSEKKDGALHRVSFQEAETAHPGTTPEAERLKAITAVAAGIVKGRPAETAGAPSRGTGEGRERQDEDESDEAFSSPLGERAIEDTIVEPAGAMMFGIETRAPADSVRGQRHAAEPSARSHVSAPEVTKSKEQSPRLHGDSSTTEDTQQRVDRMVVLSSGAAASRAEGKQEDGGASGITAVTGDLGNRSCKDILDRVGSREQEAQKLDLGSELKADSVHTEIENKSQRQLLRRSDTASAFFAGEAKEIAGLVTNKEEQQGQVGGARMGERRTVHVVSRQAKIRSGGHPEEEEFDWGMNRNPTNDTGGLVERRRRSDSSTAAENQQKPAASGGGAAAALGRLLPWKKLGGGGGANRKEEESRAQGEENKAGAMSAGRGVSESAAEKVTAAQARAGRERESEAAFRGAIQEIMIADGVQWKPGKTGGSQRSSSAWSAAPETPSQEATGKLSKHEQLNRLPPAELRRAETPHLTPEPLSPCDSEAGKRMFG